MSEKVILDKSIDFAVRIINLRKHLTATKNEYEISKQILRSGTSIGANITEAQDAQSKADFISKMSISLKECKETRYWLTLLVKTDYITQEEYKSLDNDAAELNALLVSIIKTTKNNLKS